MTTQLSKVKTKRFVLNVFRINTLVLSTRNTMLKSNKASPKICCERYRKHLRHFNSFDKNVFRTMKKVIVSKKICSSRSDKSFSTGAISSYKGNQLNATKKTAKSDLIFDQNMPCNEKVDYCKNCGDVASNIEINSKSASNITRNRLQSTSRHTVDKSRNRSIRNSKNKSSVKINNENKPIQQYYRNEKFYQSTDSFYATDNNIKKASKVSLNTIIEYPEKVSEKAESAIFEIYPESFEEEVVFMDPDDKETVKKLKVFRKNNYFECHSAKSRIHSKLSVTSLNNHKCVYRFYLNDRLFPVPLNTDYQETIRCIECQLPLEKYCENLHINGTVQAKVKLNGEIQNMLLMLPVKNSLIVKERRKVPKDKRDLDSLYFGIIKLDLNGDSKFNRNLPSDSLALRYQKGYKELTVNKKYEYDGIGNNDIIII